MIKEIIIDSHPRESRVAVLIDGKLDWFFLERQEGRRSLANIYKGKVNNILPGLNAAFVDIGTGKHGFLPMDETAESSTLWADFADDEEGEKRPPPRRGMTIQNLLQRNQEILVQVVKEPIGTKGPRLTTQISLAGRFLVLMPREARIGVSRKISDRAERHRLRSLIREIGVPPEVGLIVRTAALHATSKELSKDLKGLLDTWREVQEREKQVSAPSLIHEEMGLVMRSLRDAPLTDVQRIVTDSKDEHRSISKYVEAFLPGSRLEVILHKGPEPLFEKYKLEEEVEKLYHPRITLACGGQIVFNQTEALVTVDVNSGKHKSSRDQEQTALTTNLQAAAEVAKQLRLRNVGGIIVIDFIDMESKKFHRQVMTVLTRELSRDRARTKVLPMSDFGLVQMTREREQESFLHRVYERCPCCEGLGLLKSPFSLALELERKLLAAFNRFPDIRRFRVEAHPDLAQYLLEEEWDHLRVLAHQKKIRLTVIDSLALGPRQYILWALTATGQQKV
ncbi:MAG: Rne/Rng family ribonuclease [Candidatus Aureabacteria bacterium]|nr:Rne/Rng family ribonuclease [Candidatus Auribacterota bacterium]